MENAKGVKALRYLLYIGLIVFAFLFALSISGNNVVEFWKALGPQILFFMISLLITYSPDFKDYIIAFNGKTNIKSIFLGVGLGIAFIIVTKLLPGFSIGIPLLPNAISDNLKFFVVGIVAPIGETIFFISIMLAIARKFTGRNMVLAVIGQAVIFALFHLGAYIFGFYELSSIGQAFSIFSQNISAFVSATIFGLISGFLVVAKGIRNIMIAIVMHMVINLSFVVKYAITNIS